MPEIHNPALYQAVQERDFDAAKKILNSADDLYEMDEALGKTLKNSRKLLELAIKNNDASMLRLLFQNKANVEFGRVFMIEAAAQHCSLEVLKILTTHFSLYINMTDAFAYAAFRGDINILDYLLEIGADINQRDRISKNTAIEMAMMGKQPKAVQFLVDRGAALNIPNKLYPSLENAVKSYLAENQPYTNYDQQLKNFGANRTVQLEAEVKTLQTKVTSLETQLHDLQKMVNPAEVSIHPRRSIFK